MSVIRTSLENNNEIGVYSKLVELVIRTREDKLRDLGPQLSKILDTTIPVQKYLELPLTDTRDQLGEGKPSKVKGTL